MPKSKLKMPVRIRPIDISTAKIKIERIAVAEGIALANEEDE